MTDEKRKDDSGDEQTAPTLRERKLLFDGWKIGMLTAAEQALEAAQILSNKLQDDPGSAELAFGAMLLGKFSKSLVTLAKIEPQQAMN